MGERDRRVDLPDPLLERDRRGMARVVARGIPRGLRERRVDLPDPLLERDRRGMARVVARVVARGLRERRAVTSFSAVSMRSGRVSFRIHFKLVICVLFRPLIKFLLERITSLLIEVIDRLILSRREASGDLATRREVETDDLPDPLLERDRREDSLGIPRGIPRGLFARREVDDDLDFFEDFFRRTRLELSGSYISLFEMALSQRFIYMWSK